MREFRLIERLKRLIPRSLQGGIPLGDDTGIFSAGGKSLLFTTDVIVEGVDFRIGKGGATPEQIGRKALAVNLSDLAAMGAKPLAFVAAFGLPQKLRGAWAERLAKGIVGPAQQFGVRWVGGDLSRSERVFISIALVGEARRPVLRKGARPGEAIYVTGRLGGSLLGRHFTFTPRLREARFLARRFRPTAMIDLSDGFIQDLEHLLRASRVGARVELKWIPVSPAALKKGRPNRRKALRAALTDGEDFELLFTLPAGRGRALEKAWCRRFPGTALTQVGETVRSHPGQIVWWEEGRSLRKLWFREKGFAHF